MCLQCFFITKVSHWSRATVTHSDLALTALNQISVHTTGLAFTTQTAITEDNERNTAQYDTCLLY